MDQRGLIETFERSFGREPTMVSHAGGRVNLIGEHTDYHDGFVFPAAIDLRTMAAGAPRDDGVIRIRSIKAEDEAEAEFSSLRPPVKVDWKAYVLGPFWALREQGYPVCGADVVIDGNVPFGGGLSSSASVEVALVGIATAMSGLALPGPEIARIARLAENGFCGVPCGIMDQMASACGREGHALLIDCRTHQMDPVRIPEEWALIVADSGVKHALGTSEYAKRQQECAEGLGRIRARHPRVKALRDATMEMVDEVRPEVEDRIYRRLRHVVTENQRCLDAREAMLRGDASAMGALLAASHRSLAEDYEVSCPELDTLVEIATGIPGVIGARLTGAGFGGNTINVVDAGRAQACAEAIAEGYASKTGRRTAVRVVQAAEGLKVSAV